MKMLPLQERRKTQQQNQTKQLEWMGKVYKYMGLTVGLVIPGMDPAQRRVSYAADITYCTNNELGFDYLRDNMAIYKQELVQRGHAFAIVDEVDSILIDEARDRKSVV